MMTSAQLALDSYRKVELDARIEGMRGAALPLLCLRQASDALGRALFADANGNTNLRQTALIEARKWLSALAHGIDQDQPIAEALSSLYSAMERSINQSMARFDTTTMQAVQRDLGDVEQALRAA